ncbi:MAG: hypothetical protein R3D63_05275 [Paracoccaceae bacterium]
MREMTDSARKSLTGGTEAKCLAAEALAEIDRARDRIANLSARLEGEVEDPFNPSSMPALAAWRAAHRSGTPSKLDTDSELRAFVLARIDTLTFVQIVLAVTAHFPPERRTSVSALTRWFRRKRQLPHTTAIDRS